MLVAGDLLGIPDREAVDVLVANLPYIPTAEVEVLPAEVRAEPRIALDGGADGLDLIRRLLSGLPDVLLPDGSAWLEIGADQADLLRQTAAVVLPGWTVVVHEDLAGLPRMAEISRAGDRAPRLTA